MKNIIRFVFVALCFVPLVVEAQYAGYYYHRIGDTVQWKCPNGYYQWWEYESYYNQNRRIDNLDGYDSYMPSQGISASYFFTPDTIKVIGIAASLGYYNYPIAQPDSQEYLYIFDARADTMIMMSETPWHYNLDSIRLVHFKGYCLNPQCFVRNGCNFSDTHTDSCCGHCEWADYLPIYEYYFDTAIYLVDSFYVGGSVYSRLTTRQQANWHGGVPPNLPLYRSAGAHSGMRHTPCGEAGMIPGSTGCTKPALPIAFYNIDTSWVDPSSPYAKRQWLYSTNEMFFLIYPIIEVDTTVPPSDVCPPLRNFQLSLLEDGCATFTWDDCPNYTGFEIAYYSDSGIVNPTTYVTTTDNFFQLCDLDSNTTYHIAVHAECEDAKKETDWTPYYRLRLVEPEPVGIGESESHLGRLTTLSPNPALDRVRVFSPFVLTQVEVYTSQGQLLTIEQAVGKEHTMDITSWPSGHYLFRITTLHGTTTKVLVKE